METEGRTEISNTSDRTVGEIRGIPGSWMRCDQCVSAEEEGEGWTDLPGFVEEALVMRTEALELNFRKCGALGKICVKYPCSTTGEWASPLTFPSNSFQYPSKNKNQKQSYAVFRCLMNPSGVALDKHEVI